MKKQTKLMLGDNIESLKKLPDNSIDSVVTDPPYGLSFMNKKWDYDVPSVEFWKEVYRVLKPGGHILSFGGTRTYHRMVVNIEDAGFEIRDQIMWLYGSGFPKSHNIGKAVDKNQGNKREVIMKNPYADGSIRKATGNVGGDDNVEFLGSYKLENGLRKDTKGNSPYEGWGTALKPANEPICLARKPLSEKSVAENVLKWGTGGINIDGCRIDLNGDDTSRKQTDIKGEVYNWSNHKGKIGSMDDKWKEGRFPANLILECICDEVIKGEKGEVKISKRDNDGGLFFNKNISEAIDYNDKGDIHTNPMCPCRLLDEQSGVSKSQSGKSKTKINNKEANWFRSNNNDEEDRWGFGDKGGASRFFYQAKVSKSERNMGLDGFEEKETKGSIGLHSVGGNPTKDNNRIQKNVHPTVKPINLMTYLCRLITPEGGIVLDPFMGSGSTGISAQLEGFRFVGMEQDKSYFDIAEARIENYEKYKKFIK